MVCDSCPPLNTASLLDNEFVVNLYNTTKHDKCSCDHCEEDLSKPLAVEILKALLTTDTLSDLNTIRLRAAYQSLAGHWQGIRDLACFNILNVAVSASGVHVNVRTEHDQEREMAISIEDFLEMMVDPNPEQSKDLNRIWAEDTGSSIVGKAPPSDPIPMVLREKPCWCCNKAMHYWQTAP